MSARSSSSSQAAASIRSPLGAGFENPAGAEGGSASVRGGAAEKREVCGDLRLESTSAGEETSHRKNEHARIIKKSLVPDEMYVRLLHNYMLLLAVRIYMQ